MPGQWPAESIEDTNLSDVVDSVQEDVMDKIAERKPENEEPEATTGWRSWGWVQTFRIDDLVDVMISHLQMLEAAVIENNI